MRTIEDVTANDKRRSAIHEAGHLVVAVASGVRGRAWIYRRETPDPFTEKTWGGRFQPYCGSVSDVIGVAGVVAEMWCDDPTIESWQILESIELGTVEPSQTDWTLIQRISEPAIATALDLLRNQREFFDWAVGALIHDEVIPDGESWDYFWSNIANKGK